MFIQKIYRFGKRYFGLLALASVLRFLTVLSILWLSVSLADDFFYFSKEAEALNQVSCF